MSLTVAFLAGVVFFFSPCVWPLYPAYITYLGGSAGMSEGGDVTDAARRRLLMNAFGFILGFSLIFVLLGATASAIGQLLLDYQEVLRRISGILIVAFGLVMLGWLRFDLFERDVHIRWQPARLNPLTAMLLGLAFGFGWTPCVGPVLAAILLYAGTLDTLQQGIQLLTAYSLGFALPFGLLALGFHRMMPLLRRLGPWLPLLHRFSGAVMVVMGLLVYSNYLQTIAWNLFYYFD